MIENKSQNNIPDEWKKERLGNLYNITSSKRVFRSEWRTKGVPFYRAREIVKLSKNGFVNNNLYISHEMYKKYNKKYGVPQKNDLLVTGVGTIGYLYRVKDKVKFYFKDGNIIWFKSKRLVSSKFIEQLFKTRLIKRQILGASPITTVATYTIDAAKKTVVYLPSLSEQNKIVKILETWDKYLEKLSKKINIKKDIKKGLMQKFFTGEVRLAGFYDEWRKVKLEDIAEIKRGQGLSKGKLVDDGKYKCILYGEIYTTYNEVIKNILSKTNQSERIKSIKNDVLIPASTTTSAMDLATATVILEDDVIIGGDINIIRDKKSNFDGIFLSYYLTHARKHELARLAQGITIVHLYGKDFKKINIELPLIEEQVAIAKVITTADQEIDTLEKNKKIIEDQKKFLLNNLITGKIRVPEFVK